MGARKTAAVGKTVRKAVARAQMRRREKAGAIRATPAAGHLTSPHLCLVRAPTIAPLTKPLERELVVATYNVHRWTGLSGRGSSDPARAGFVISELGADVIALQEVMRPHQGEDPLEGLAEALGLHVAFAATRVHKRGELGNAILSRWPFGGVSMLDLSYSRVESRVAVAAQIPSGNGVLEVVATHLALADRTRHRQVLSLLNHPQLLNHPTVLLGDMNAWRKCAATRELDRHHAHHDIEWPSSFPAARPVMALDRIYGSGTEILDVKAHQSRAAQRASDHLPVVARVRISG